MLGSPFVLAKKSKDPAEKPFWISYADLMTSLMVLFLVTMSVALLAVTKEVDQKKQAQETYENEISQLLNEIEQASAEYPGMTVDKARQVIDFGPKALFKWKDYSVTEETARTLRDFVQHKLLRIARSELGQKVLKRVVVEGYTDITGDYLYNLDLSLKRSHRVLCVLLRQPMTRESELTELEQKEIRKLFLVGGYSLNSARESLENSRRIELRLEIYGIDDKRNRLEELTTIKLGDCQLDRDARTPK